MNFCSVKTKMACAVLVLVGIIMAATSIVSMLHFEKTFKQSISRDQRALLDAVAIQFDENIFSALLDLDGISDRVTPAIMADRRKAQSFLDSQEREMQFFDNSLALFSKEGILIAATPQGISLIGKNYSFRGYFKETIETGKICISPPFHSIQKTSYPIIMFSTPIYDERGDPIGVLGGAVTLTKQRYLRSLASLKIGHNGYLSLYDGNHTVLMHPDSSQILKRLDRATNQLVDRAIHGVEGTEETVSRRGVPVLQSVKTLKSAPWVLAISYPLEDAYASLYTARKYYLGACALAALFSAFVIWHLMKYLTSPLIAFTRHLEKLPLDGSPPVELGSNDEVGILARAFNVMVTELARREKALQAQKEFAESLVLNLALPTFVVDKQHRLLYWNRGCEELTGIKAERVVGTDGHTSAFYGEAAPTVADVIIDGSFERFAPRYGMCYPSKLLPTGWRCEGWQESRGGRRRYVLVDAAPIQDSAGEVVAAIETIQDITELKEAEQELARSRDFYLTLFESFPTMIWRAATNGECDYVNRTWLEFTGRSREEDLGTGWLELVHPEDRDQCVCTYVDSFQTRTPFQVEFRLLRHDGTYRKILGINRPFEEVGGSFAGYIGSGYDVTEREDAAAEILKLSRAVEQSPNAVVLASRDGTIEYLNRPTPARAFAPEELLGQDLRLLLQNDQGIDPEHAIAAAVEQGAEWRSEISTTNRRGEVLWESFSLAPIRNREGAVTHIAAIIADVTVRKHAEEALRESEERYRHLFEENPQPMWVFDRETLLILAVNNAAVRHYGYSREEFLSMTIREVRPAEDLCAFLDEVARTSDGLKDAGLWRHVKKDGSIIMVEITSHRVNFAGRDAELVLCHDVTEKKRIQQELVLSEQRYRNIFDGVRDIILSVGRDSCFLSLNRGFERLTGWPCSDWIGRSLTELIHPEDLPRVMEVFQATLGGAVVREFTFRIRTSSGEALLLEIHAAPQYKDGNVVSVQGIARDITERKRAEEKQEYLQRRLSALWNIARVADADMESLHHIALRESAVMTRSRYAFFGAISEDTSEIALRCWCSDSGREAAGVHRLPMKDAGLWGEAVRSGNPIIINDPPGYDVVSLPGSAGHPIQRIVVVPVALDGRILAVSAVANKATDYLDEDVEQINAFATNLQIIFEKKRAEESLIKFSHAIEQSPVSVVITDAACNIEFVNPMFTRTTGFALDEVRGSNGLMLQGDEGYEGMEKITWKERTEGETWSAVVQSRKKNGELFWETMSVSPIRNSDNAITNYMIIKEDITQQRRLEEQLRQAQKMEAVGTLAGGIAHDFNNILTAITGYCTLIERKSLEGKDITLYLAKLVASVDRAAGLTRNLLAYSRKQPMRTEVVELNGVVKKVDHLLSRLLHEDIELQVLPSQEPLRVMADSVQIEQILMNLATNARDSMPSGGLLQIATSRVCLDADYAKSHGYGRRGPFAVLTVSDSGCGMDRGSAERIFEPFYTTKEVGKGTGLGLSIVYGIVKQHHGHINVYSEPGHGTTFTIYLPLTESTDLEQVAALATPPPRGTETVLLVEDDPEIRSTLRELLGDFGYRVIDAADGEEGVDKFRRHMDEIDLVILDVVMPKKNGRAALEEIRGVRPDARAIFISGYTADILSAKGVLEKEITLVSKPIGVEQLLSKMREVLPSAATP